MLEISEQTLGLLIVVCAIAAINWGLHAMNPKNEIFTMVGLDANVKNMIYYAIAIAGVIVLGKRYKMF
jgi:uncharacterized membrane protein YuzA (DUF378 family)